MLLIILDTLELFGMDFNRNYLIILYISNVFSGKNEIIPVEIHSN